MVDSIICTMRKQPKYFLEKKLSDSIYLEPPTNNEILDQVTSLKNKAVGHGNIQPFFDIRDVAYNLIHFYLHNRQ